MVCKWERLHEPKRRRILKYPRREKFGSASGSRLSICTRLRAHLLAASLPLASNYPPSSTGRTKTYVVIWFEFTNVVIAYRGLSIIMKLKIKCEIKHRSASCMIFFSVPSRFEININQGTNINVKEETLSAFLYRNSKTAQIKVQARMNRGALRG